MTPGIRRMRSIGRWAARLMGAAAVAAIAAAPASAQEFDPAFNATTNARVYAMVLQTDGKVVIGGTFTQVNGVARPYIARLNADGSLDTTYAPVSNSAIFALALQADGKVVAGGNFTVVDGLTRLALVRFNTDGSVDTAFTPGVNIGIGNNSQRNVFRLLIEPDGDIIVAGEYLTVNSVARSNIARIDANGVLDGAFAPQVDWSIYALARQSDGRILIGGRFTAIGGVARTGFARLNAGGSLDTSFNVGLATNTAPVTHAIAVRPDGRILVGGRFATCNGVTRLNLAQLNANGTLDTTFDPSMTSRRAFDTAVRGLAIQADGRVVVSGTFDWVAGVDTYFVTRLTAAGAVDTTFGVAFGSWAYRFVSELIVQPDGHILAAGEFGANVARFLGTDPTPVNADLSLSMTVQPTTYASPGTLQYALTVSHVGTDVASSILVTDTLPAGLTFGSCINAVYVVCGGTGNARTFTFPSLLPNETVTINFSASVVAGQTAPIVNTASVTSLVPDLATGNNSATATATAPGVPGADLGLTAVASPTTLTPGANLTYTLTLTNAGPNAATNVVVSDTLPTGLTYLSCSAPGGTCGGSGLARTVSYGSRAAGSTSTITIVARVPDDRTTPIVNTATVGSATNDPNPANNTVTITVGDGDSDGLPDDWETRFGLDPGSATGDNGATGDPDHDSLTNAQELAGGTHPRGFFHPMLAEGASNGFFDVQIALLNVGTQTGRVLIRYLQPGGTVITQYEQLPPGRRSTRGRPAGLTSNDFSTIVESDQSIVLDRTMTWGGGYGSHAETGVAGPSTTWYLAEGSTSGDFSLFYLLQNPNPVATVATVRYLLPLGQAPIVRTYPLPPNSRTTIAVDEQGGALASTDVSAAITAPLGIVVERAMYRSTPSQPFAAGHDSAGVTAPATSWFLAEGATGPFFDCFILLANPNAQAATTTIDYLLSDGRTFSKTYTVPGNGRFTVWVDNEQLPAGSGIQPLANVAVSSTVTSSLPIVVERTMWWPSPETTGDFWTEAHNSPGATATATRWALAEGEVGGAQHADTYILIANTSTTAGSARVRLHFEDGTSVERTFPLLPRSRRNVNVSVDFPTSAGRRFGSVIESLGSPAAAIVVERAMYTSPGGVVWAAGTNALATPIP